MPIVGVSTKGSQDPVAEAALAVENSERSVSAVVYKFYRKRMRRALVKVLREKGRRVRLLVDRRQLEGENDSFVPEAARAGAEVRKWKGGKLHAKFMIVDESEVLSGSYNWTKKAAKSNTELLLRFDDQDTVATFVREFEKLWRLGEPWTAPTHAGGVVYKDSKQGRLYLAVQSSKEPSHWVFPKGHVEGDETFKKAAVREVREEAAVAAKIIAPIGTRSFEGPRERVRVNYYLMRHKHDVKPDENREKAWLPYEVMRETLSFDDAVELLREAHEHKALRGRKG